jgi:hypothetical protein
MRTDLDCAHDENPPNGRQAMRHRQFLTAFTLITSEVFNKAKEL